MYTGLLTSCSYTGEVCYVTCPVTKAGTLCCQKKTVVEDMQLIHRQTSTGTQEADMASQERHIAWLDAGVNVMRHGIPCTRDFGDAF